MHICLLYIICSCVCYLHFTRHMANDRDRKELHVEAFLAKLTGFYDGVRYTTDEGVHPFHLPRHVATKLKTYIDVLLAHYAWLAKNALEENQYQRRVVPKHHYMWHVGKEAMHLSPRMSWCYSNKHVFVCVWF